MGYLQSPGIMIERTNDADCQPLLDYSMPAEPEAVPDARRAAMRICMDLGITNDECADLDLALGEALANAVVHSKPDVFEDDDQKDVHIGAWDYKDYLIVEVTNHGIRFQPPLPPYMMPIPSEHDTHGRGLPMMQMLTDAMVVCEGDVTDGGASIYLVKKISSDRQKS